MSEAVATAAPDALAVAAGTTCAEAVAAAGLPTAGPKAIIVVRDADGRLRDLAWTPAENTVVTPVSMESPDGLAVLRHSTAHVLAQAVQDVFPDAKLGIGPPIDNGFYYDFDVAKPFQPDDLGRLEKRMQEIVKAGQLFRRRRFESVDEAKAELADEPYKLELVDVKSDGTGGADLDADEAVEVGGAELTIYDNVDPATEKVVWSDLCRGPHLPSTKLINAAAVKLMRTAAAYWRGSEKNPQLQRVYGTAWPTREQLKDYLKLLEEAARRDHRKLGADLDLFSFPDEIGSGLAVFHPKGGIIRRELENYSRLAHEAAGYSFVNTPHITKSDLFVTSGHLPYYADTMFPPMQLEGAEYRLKPMNCPFHNLIFQARGRSYRELPLRLFEFGSVYRYEKSGVVHGLTRVRGLTMDDAHIYTHPGADADRAAGAARVRARPAARLRSGRLLPGAVDPGRLGQVPRRAGRVGDGDRGAARRPPSSPASNLCPTRAAPRSTGRRSPYRRATPSAAPGRCRPSSSTSTSRSGSASSTRPPTAPASSR